MEPLYNIYFAGEVLEGQQPAEVRERLRALFKANDATLDKLFSGRAQMVKRECDKATAVKYKQAMERAGARPLIKAVQAAPPPPETASPDATASASKAERIAALAAAPDMGFSHPQEPGPIEYYREGEIELALLPEGTDVLLPDERSEPIVADIDISALDVLEQGGRLSPEPPAPPPAPETGHLSMGEVGEDIPTLPSGQAPLEPDTDALDLSPEGTDFSDCAPPPPQAPELDLSAMDLAPEGSDVLEQKYRKGEEPPAPDTGHISLQD